MVFLFLDCLLVIIYIFYFGFDVCVYSGLDELLWNFDFVDLEDLFVY